MIFKIAATNFVVVFLYSKPSLNMFHLVPARVMNFSMGLEDRYAGEVAHAFSFGEQRFLTGCFNRLWSMEQYPDEKQRGEPMYKHDWHRTVVEFIGFAFTEGAAGNVFRVVDGNRNVRVSGWYLQVWFESDDVEATVGWTRQAILEYDTMDITSKLILLQRWFRKSNARRRPRRLALAMALHPRLGNGSWLTNIPTELARTLILAAT